MFKAVSTSYLCSTTLFPGIAVVGQKAFVAFDAGRLAKDYLTVFHVKDIVDGSLVRHRSLEAVEVLIGGVAPLNLAECSCAGQELILQVVGADTPGGHW